MRRHRILLADHQSQVLYLLRILPSDDYDVAGAVHEGPDLIAAARALKPDIVVMDIDALRLRTIGIVRQLRKVVPDCRVILKSSRNSDFMAEAYAAGASGYLVKGDSFSLLSAIEAVTDRQERQGGGIGYSQPKVPDSMTYWRNVPREIGHAPDMKQTSRRS